MIWLLALPLRIARGLWRMINPARTANRIPWGRTVIAIQIAVALAFLGYTLSKKSIRLPLSGEPYQVHVLMADAQGLDRLDEPAAAVAGTPLGSVTHVEYLGGQALATLTFPGEVRGKIYSDASVFVRPASALQNLLVNVDPGTPPSEGGEVLPDDEPIPPERTAGYVTIDQLTSVLDADTRAYLSIVIDQAQVSVDGAEGELRNALDELGNLAVSAKPLARALAERRRLLTALVGHLDTVAGTVGSRGRQLAEAIDAGNATLAVTSERGTEIEELTRDLGPVLAEVSTSLDNARELSRILVPALDILIPAAGPLAEGVARMNGLLPRADALVDRFEGLVKDGARPLRLMLKGTKGVGGRVKAMTPVMRDLTALARRLNTHSDGFAQTADTLSAAGSYQDNNGSYAPIDVVSEEPRPENLGFPANASSARQNRAERELAMALEASCVAGNSLACVYRFNVPGLPKKPILRDLPLPKKQRGNR